MSARFILCAAFVPICLAGRLAAADPGYVDFGKIAAAKCGEYVDVNLNARLLKFASIIARVSDKEAGDVISGLTQVRVKVISLDETNRTAAMQRISEIRAQLTQQGWDQIVTARGKKAEDVAIFAKSRGEDSLAGVVVTVVDETKRQLVLVNVVGEIKPDQLAVLAEHFHIDPLRNAKIPAKS